MRDAALSGRTLREPPIHGRDEAGVAHLEVLVRDAEAPREEAHRELDRLEALVPLRRLEPFEAHLGGALEALDLRPPLCLVGREGRRDVRVAQESAG